ncbi:MAG: acetylglutamate kinase [Balneolales bacterium]
MDTVLIKLSGNVVSEESSLDKLSDYILSLKKQGKQVVLTHGGGMQTTDLSERLGLAVQQVAGRRFTDEQTLEVLLYIIGGKLNRNIVSFLRKHDISSVGISGIDGGLTTSSRRAPITIDGESMDFGLVGEIDSVDVSLAEQLLKSGFVPVIGCLTWSPEEGILNINADTFAIRISLALHVSELILLMNPPAVLDADQNPVPVLRRDDWQRGLKEGWIKDGMKPKLLTAFEALEKGIRSVRLTSAEVLATGGGTKLVSD